MELIVSFRGDYGFLSNFSPHNTWGDRFWGQCPVGHGENWLGRLLMEVRDDGDA